MTMFGQKPILLAIDGSPTAAVATEKAIELAQALKAPLVVVSVWQLPADPLRPIVTDFDRLGREHAAEVAEEAAARAREEGVEAESLALAGYVPEEICVLAEHRAAQLIVLGSHGWGPVRRFFYGSVSTGVLHGSNRPVLVVPPAAGAPTTAPERETAGAV
jgi:nucleotide-binding universal stress UspA family protein